MIVRTRPSDTEREDRVARLIEKAWKCEVFRTGYQDDLDFFLLRNGRTEAVAELKNRNVPSDHYETIFLSRHKWDALHRAAWGHEIEAFYLVAFTDGVFYIRLDKIDPRNVKPGGRSDREDAPNDWEMMILVPVADMRRLGGLEE